MNTKIMYDSVVINKKKYDIEIKLVEISVGKHIFNKWYCAYVTLPMMKQDATNILSHCTFHQKDKYGVDTAHAWNDGMTMEQKYDDALYQIRELIKSFNRIQKKVKQ